VGTTPLNLTLPRGNGKLDIGADLVDIVWSARTCRHFASEVFRIEGSGARYISSMLAFGAVRLGANAGRMPPVSSLAINTNALIKDRSRQTDNAWFSISIFNGPILGV